MPKPSHILSFATDNEGQLFVHADASGLDYLIHSLTRIRRKLANGVCDHDHLRTDCWAGSELTEQAPEEGAQTIHHVKVYGRTPEWVQKHGLSA